VTYEVYTLSTDKEGKEVDVERLVAELEELRRSLSMTAKAIDERLEQIINTLKAKAVEKEAGADEENPAESREEAEEEAEAPAVRPPPTLRPDQLPPLFRSQAPQKAEETTTPTTNTAAPAQRTDKTKKTAGTVDKGFSAAAAKLDWRPMPSTPGVEWAFLTDRDGNLAEGFEEYGELLAKAGRTPIRPPGDEYEYTVGYSGQGKPKFLRRRRRSEGEE
jgi:chemotaxis protein histidine kinase CheA